MAGHELGHHNPYLSALIGGNDVNGTVPGNRTNHFKGTFSAGSVGEDEVDRISSGNRTLGMKGTFAGNGDQEMQGYSSLWANPTKVPFPQKALGA